MNLKEKIKQLPTSPGVYLMKDSSGGILYVGKSKNLHNRVQSYFQNYKAHSPKVEKLVKHLKDFDYILTDTEFEAFMLECQLIHEIKPLYNRMMKSPESYVYVVVQKEKGRVNLDIAHNLENDHHLYFGPFTGKSTVERAIQAIKEFYKIDCNHPFNGKSPCFNHTLGLCRGICFHPEAMEEYKNIMLKVVAFLKREDNTILDEMEEEMVKSSESFDFEKAAKLRDWIKLVNLLIVKEKIVEFTSKNHNIVVTERMDDKRVKLFLISRNNILLSDIIELDNYKVKSLIEKIKKELKNHLQAENCISKEVRKSELDEAQIIYRYLNSNNCEYVLVEDEWLEEDNDRLEVAVKEKVVSYFCL
jgi:excinuclease ABC subunit C